MASRVRSDFVIQQTDRMIVGYSDQRDMEFKTV